MWHCTIMDTCLTVIPRTNNEITLNILTLFKVASASWQVLYSSSFGSRRVRRASISNGSRVMRCIGSIRKECRDKDWHTALFSSCNRTSENFVFCSLQETSHYIQHKAFTVAPCWRTGDVQRTPEVENLTWKNITHDSQCAIQMHYCKMLVLVF